MKIRNKWRWKSLNVIIAISTTLIAVFAVVIITVVMNSRFNLSIERSTEQMNKQIIESVSTNIDSYLKEMISISDRVSSWLDEGNLELNRQPFDLFLREDIDTIMAVDSTGEPVFRTDNRKLKEQVAFNEQAWFQNIIPGSIVYKVTPPHVQRLFENKYNWVISLSRGVSWLNEADKKQSGVVLVDLNVTNIQKMCSKEFGDNGYIFILGPNDEIIYHPQQQMLYAGIRSDELESIKMLKGGSHQISIGDNNYNVTISNLKNAEWRIVGVSQLKGLFSYDRQLKDFISLILLCIGVIIIVLSIIISFWITKPIHQLIFLMKKVEGGDLTINSDVAGSYEVMQLSLTFNDMVIKVNELMQQILLEQEELRRNEMTILHTQISPHFLYNTLDSIVWMAESGDQKNVIKMIEALANFFRLSLAKGKETISVADELRHAESYLVIQKIRFSNQFEYRFEIDDECTQLKTLKIMLQPIIENAIIHGVANLPYKGIITISVFQEADQLVFMVKDNGFGITPEKLKIILDKTNTERTGIGIGNVNQRIQLMYGEQYGLVYESEPDEGTTVYIYLPMIFE